MKRFAILLMIALFVVSVGLTIRGDTEGDATATVFVVVDPNVAVTAGTPIVDAGTVQMGQFCATIRFRVDANLQQVSLSVEASDLWKGDDPLGTEVLPIPLDLSAGAVIAPTNAMPLAGGSTTASYTGDTQIGNFPAKSTELIAFESSQNNHFSQDVFVTVCWNQDDPEKPTGEYSGKVKLNCILLP